MNGFTDIHGHFVYGVDDGAQTRQQMEAMLDAAHADHVTALFATPHAIPGIKPFDRAKFVSNVREAQLYVQQKGYPIQIYPGAEIMYTPSMIRNVTEQTLPTIASSDYVLLEFVPDISFEGLSDALAHMERADYIPILAHIERYKCLQGHAAYQLRERYNIRYQLNGASVIHGRGYFKDRLIKKWLKDKLIDFVASDAHDCTRRPTCMSKAYEALRKEYGASYAERLTRLPLE